MTGIYIRVKDKETGKWESEDITFVSDEDLADWLDTLDKEALKRVVIRTIDVLRDAEKELTACGYYDD
jgi:DNA-directed RNA polymerase specialized sigma subunit